jgi:hypothetical protein
MFSRIDAKYGSGQSWLRILLKRSRGQAKINWVSALQSLRKRPLPSGCGENGGKPTWKNIG